MGEFDDILYPGSPFLPEITEKNLTQVLHDITTLHRPSCVSVSFELSQVAIDLHQYHGSDLVWLVDNFKTDVKSIDLFMFGYTISPSLIIGSFILKSFGAKEAFQRICPTAADTFLLSLNGYKSAQLLECYYIYNSTLHNPKQAGLEITAHCQKEPFSVNRFFLAGIESFKTNYLQLFQLLDDIQ